MGHVEAGMRSYDERMLEEINRKVCDHVSNFLFVYHDNYKKKAIKEGISPDKIFVVGNTIVEPLQKIKSKPQKSKHILIDIHRPENFKYKDRMIKIIDFVKLCSKKTRAPYGVQVLQAFCEVVQAIAITFRADQLSCFTW